MKPILDKIFELVGEHSTDYLDFQKIDPMYELHFADKTIPMTSDHAAMREIISQMFPGEEKGFDQYLQYEEVRLKKMYPCLEVDY